MIDLSIQSYLKDATRTIEVKIFKAEVYFLTNLDAKEGDRKIQKVKMWPFYFASRLELGHTFSKGCGSVYEKLECVRNMLNATNPDQCTRPM